MITMEPRTPEQNFQAMYKNIVATLEESPTHFHIASAAATLRTELAADDEDCITLAKHLHDMLCQLDDARFSMYDLLDAIINHPETPGCKELNRLWNKHQDDTRPWENMIIAMAENKRDVYADETPDYDKFRQYLAACKES